MVKAVCRTGSMLEFNFDKLSISITDFPGTYTIFAPTNAAFAKIPAATLAALASDTQALTNVLLYHVVQGRVLSRDARDELKVTTMNGQDARFNIYSHNNAVTIQGSQITEFDRRASNGVIHVIDTVILPPTGDIVDFVSNSTELSTLYTLVGQAGIASALKGDGVTLFAPTNAAFAKLSSAAVASITSNPQTLADILTYHAIGSTEYSKGLYNRERIQTLDREGDTVLISTSSGSVLVNTAKVTKADISTTNGVIHEIDNILLPLRYLNLVIVG